MLTLPILANDTEQTGRIGHVVVQVDSTNYEPFTLTIEVSATNKIVPTGAPTLSKTTLTSGEKLGSVTLSGTMQDSGTDVPGTFTWDEPETCPPWVLIRLRGRSPRTMPSTTRRCTVRCS